MWRKLFAGGCLIFALVAVGSVMAQDATSEATENMMPSLTGVTWQWIHSADPMQEMDVPSGKYTITFGDDGNFHAKADCNSVLGSYTSDTNTITLKPGPSTLMLCPPDSLGDTFTKYLGQVAVYSFTDAGDLLLELPADGGTLTLSAQPQITGTVAYRQKIALPDDAVVRVQIQDVTVADAPSLLIGEQVIDTNGAQVPIPFAVSYSASAVQENHRYSLSARITDGEGNLLFITDTIVSVITGENPANDLQLMLVQVHA
ncbi:MAG: META domain-containing protein [Chloroflexi bacterium]|nr:META domain-containing protein [Chloroflexota bacterium]